MSNLSLEYKGRTMHSRYPGSQNLFASQFLEEVLHQNGGWGRGEGGIKNEKDRGSRKLKAVRPAVRFQQAGGVGQQSLTR